MVAFVSCALLTPLVFAEGTTANANELWIGSRREKQKCNCH
jgi:hypothetical protein